MATRIGVDVGGTFTDVVIHNEKDGGELVGKGATVTAAPDKGIADVIERCFPQQLLEDADYFLHGTTVGLNALLERKGARVGLITSEGFRDTLELRRADREDLYNLFWKAPEPLVRRKLRIGVKGRVLRDGAVIEPLDSSDVEKALELFQKEGVESIAVVLINSYVNPDHELAVESVLREYGFDGDISLSHQVTGEFREYERTSTTVIDAYVRPRVSKYVKDLENTIRGKGFGGEFLITRSGGGAMTFAEAVDRPFETVMSGPVAGAVGAGQLCREHEYSRGITADVGGTSFDTCLIIDGRPQVKYEGWIADMPLQTPWVDVRSIGAGGGSLAYVEGGLLRAGPQSAGSTPGPICYGRGGTQPTATDSAAVLGMLAFGELAGGIRLDIEASRRGLHDLGKELGLEAEAVAQGVVKILNASMAGAMRSITVEVGEDPRDAVLIPFGGAGPLFGTVMARELNMSKLVVPTAAGNFSARGLLTQDVTRSAARTAVMPLNESGLDQVNLILAELYADLERRSVASEGLRGHVTFEAALDLRYEGQEYTLTIALSCEDGRVVDGIGDVTKSFEADYKRTYGHLLDESVEVVAVRATSRLPLPRTGIAVARDRAINGASSRSVKAFSFDRNEWLDFAVMNRADISGSGLEGPMIITEETTTTYVDADFIVDVHQDGTLIIEDRGSK